MQLRAFGRREEIPTSSHVCQLYHRPDEVAPLVAGLFASSAAGERELCLYIGPPVAIAQVQAQLRLLKVDVDAGLAGGQFVFTDDRTEFLSQGRFDPFYLLSNHLNLINRSTRADFTGVRLAIEMTWLTEGVATPAHILKYEALCDAVFTFQRQPIVAIAQYSRARLGDQITGEMMKLHPLAYWGHFLKRNPSYLNSEQYFLKILKATRHRNQPGS